MKINFRKKSKNNSDILKRFRFVGIFAGIAVLALGVMAAISVQTAKVSEPQQKTDQTRRTVMSRQTENNFSKVAKQAAPIDKQTGQIRPLTPEEAKKLADGIKELVNQSDEGLVQVQRPDGSVSVDLQGRFQNVAVAQKNSDGTVAQSCVDNPQAAASFFGIDPGYFDNNPKSVVSKTKNLSSAGKKAVKNSTEEGELK